MWRFRSTINSLKQRKEYDNVGEFLLDLRKSKNLTQSELAKAIDASNQAVSKWENNNGFPDILYQSKLCNVLDISLEELHAGNFNYSARRKKLLVKLTSYIILIFMIIFIPLFILLSIYFFRTYDSFHVYEIYNANKDEVTSIEIRGIYVTSKNMNTLYLSSIEPFLSKWKDTDIISIDVFNNDEIIYHSNNYQDLMIKLDANKKINLDDLIVKASVNNEVDLYSSKIDYSDIYESDEYDQELYNFKTFKTDEEIIKSLLENDFVKKNDNEYEKKIKNGNVDYYLKERKLSYTNALNYIYSYFVYHGDMNNLDVKIFQNQNGINIMIEKYNYNLNNNKINCSFGNCATLDDTLKTLEEYLTLLFVE